MYTCCTLLCGSANRVANRVAKRVARPTATAARTALLAFGHQEFNGVVWTHVSAITDGLFWVPWTCPPRPLPPQAQAAVAADAPTCPRRATLHHRARACRVWTDRPGWPCKPVRVHKLEHAGVSVVEKLAALARELATAGVDALLVNDLAEIAWLTNLRGADVDCNPVFVAYAIVKTDGATLFVHDGAVDAEVEGYLKTNGVAVAAYDKVQMSAFAQSFHVVPCTLCVGVNRAAAGVRPRAMVRSRVKWDRDPLSFPTQLCPRTLDTVRINTGFSYCIPWVPGGLTCALAPVRTLSCMPPWFCSTHCLLRTARVLVAGLVSILAVGLVCSGPQGHETGPGRAAAREMRACQMQQAAGVATLAPKEIVARSVCRRLCASPCQHRLPRQHNT